MLRPLAIVIEISILTGLIYSIFMACRLTILDVGIDSRYDPFVKWAMRVIGTMAIAFFVAHLILFYPRISP